jgi:DNA-binding winged helix-turn-helix (wHTH) protein/TolB-like protein/tetratricopeptide (TPR) repeat protein
MPSTLPPLVRFANFEVNLRAGELRREGSKVRLQEQPFSLLTVLLESAGEVVTREELRKRLWSEDTFVDFDHRLAVAVSKLRDALRDSVEKPLFVETVGRRGYRFVGQLESTDSLMDSKGGVGETPLPSSRPPAKVELPNVAPPGSTRSRTSSLILLSSIGFAILLGVTVLPKFRHIRSAKEQFLSPRSLAILPLQNHGQDTNSDFLGLSLADVLITKLAYVHSLSVRPSAAIEKYRGTAIDLQKVAADLKVDTLLTGSFIRDGDNLRITYQLVDAKTEKIQGQGVIDLKYDNLLTVQDKVTSQLVSELQLTLSPTEAERLPEAAVNPLAYDYFLHGLDFYGQHKFPMAIKMFEKSTEIDPNYALAWAYLGASYTSDAAFELGGREQYRRAQAAYERALATRPNLLDAQMFLANLLVDTGKVEQAVPLLRDALKTNGNYAAAHWELGYAYRFAGMLDESVAECERARQLDPFLKANGSVLNTYLYLGQYQKFLESLPVDDSSFTLFYRGFAEFHEKEFDKASRDFDRAYELDPTLYTGIGKALSDSIHERKAKALDRLNGLEKKIRDQGVGDPEGTYKIAQVYALLGDKISAMRVLRMSVESGFFSYPYLSRDPLLNDLRREPEFDQTLNTARQRHEAFKRDFFK